MKDCGWTLHNDQGQPGEEKTMESKNIVAEHSATPSCSTAVDAYEMRRVRAMLSEHPELRWEAIPNFVLSVAHAATELRKFAEMRRQGIKLSPESVEAARYIEDMIRCRYREVFGAELGQ